MSISRKRALIAARFEMLDFVASDICLFAKRLSSENRRLLADKEQLGQTLQRQIASSHGVAAAAAASDGSAASAALATLKKEELIWLLGELESKKPEHW